LYTESILFNQIIGDYGLLFGEGKMYTSKIECPNCNRKSESDYARVWYCSKCGYINYVEDLYRILRVIGIPNELVKEIKQKVTNINNQAVI
jgi:ribosomal protein L37AE/L43A